MKKSLVILSLSFLFCTCAFAEPEIKGTPDELRIYLGGEKHFVDLTATHQSKVKADRAIVNINITTIEPSLQRAIERNREIEKTVIKTLVKALIPEENIMTTSFSSIPQSGLFNRKVKNYRISNVIKVRINDEKQFIQIAGMVDGFKEISLAGMDYESSEKETLKMEAIGKACDIINAKKELFENKFGVKLLIRGFQDETIEDYLSTGVMADFEEASYLSKMSISSPQQVETGFGQIILRSKVTAAFEIETK